MPSAAMPASEVLSSDLAFTSGWERQIDDLVYALYGLTPEEIKIVVGNPK